MEEKEEIFFPEDDNLGAGQEEIEEVEEDIAEEAEEVEEATEAAPAEEENETEKRYMALFAEYENFRKRSVKEKENLYADAVLSVTGQWLGIVDNIERAMASAQNADENSVESIVKGIEMIGKQVEDILNKLEIKEIDAARGTAFDPNLHEAVMHIEDPDLGEQEIAQTFSKGYIYKDRVIRHAVVQIAN